jgi:hypothetical protein
MLMAIALAKREKQIRVSDRLRWYIRRGLRQCIESIGLQKYDSNYHLMESLHIQ